MVFIVVKQSEEDQFFFETSCETEIDGIVEELTRLHNLRTQITNLTQDLEKSLQKSIPKEEKEESENDGLLLDPSLVQRIDKQINEARALISNVQVERKVVAKEEELKNQLNELEASRALLSQKEDFEETKGLLDPSNSTLWWAGKELLRSEKLKKFIGGNEKTKIVTKLQKKGLGPPPREFMSTEQQKEILAFNYRRQKELEKLEQDNADDYLNSSWADPRGLQRGFQGLGNISWKPQ